MPAFVVRFHNPLMWDRFRTSPLSNQDQADYYHDGEIAEPTMPTPEARKQRRERQAREVQESQERLRESIANTQRLLEESNAMLQRHRQERESQDDD